MYYLTYGQNFVIAPKTLGEITYTCRIVRYSDGSVSIAACDFAIFREAGWESEKERKPRQAQFIPSEANIERAIRRARSDMRELVRNNPLPWFVTLTFDASKIDRYDPAEIVRRVGFWCDNNVRRKGLVYALVPEYHKDEAIHFHGFFNDALTYVDSGHSLGGRKVYNIRDWSFGFSAAERVEDSGKSLNYALKYVGKNGAKIGGRWWYHGGKFVKPDRYYYNLSCSDLAAFGGTSRHIDRLGCDMTFLDLGREECKTFMQYYGLAFGKTPEFI